MLYRFIFACFFAVGLTTAVNAQKAAANVTPYERNDKSFFYSNSERPKNIIGHYTYEGKGGEPVVDVNADGTGRFQPHMRPPIPMQWWIETNAQGEVTKTVGVNGAYQVIMVVRWGAGGGTAYPEGTYQGMQVTVSPDDNEARIMGERVKKLN